MRNIIWLQKSFLIKNYIFVSISIKTVISKMILVTEKVILVTN